MTKPLPTPMQREVNKCYENSFHLLQEISTTVVERRKNFMRKGMASLCPKMSSTKSYCDGGNSNGGISDGRGNRHNQLRKMTTTTMAGTCYGKKRTPPAMDKNHINTCVH